MKTYTYDFKGEAASLVEQARSKAQLNGVNLTGDDKAGQFASFGIEGTYEIQGQAISVTITQKPAFIPWSLVESQLEQFFGSSA